MKSWESAGLAQKSVIKTTAARVYLCMVAVNDQEIATLVPIVMKTGSDWSLIKQASAVLLTIHESRTTCVSLKQQHRLLGHV